MHFLSSIEVCLLKVTLIALSKYERGKGLKKFERFLVSKVEFNFKISMELKLYLWMQFSLDGFMLVKMR